MSLMAVCMSETVYGQIDDERMQRDIRVASGILQTLSQTDATLVMYGDNVTGDYIDGYGVMFSIGGGYSFVAPRAPRGRAVVLGTREAKEVKEVKDVKEAVVWSQGNNGSVSVTVEDEDDDLIEDKQSDINEIMSLFLADYSQLIGQLAPTDKIVVSTKKSDYFYRFKMSDGDETTVTSSQSAGNNGITAELLKKDHDNFLSGKLTREQLLEKIKFIEHTSENARAKDLDLFGSMIKTLYDVDYTDSYFISWTPEYERIHGVGAIYTFKVFSSYDENGLYRMPGINQEGLNEDQRTENVVALYPLFVKSFKENLIQYGRAIKSLKDDEMVMARITLTKCDGCEIPKRLQFSVKQSVLKDFNSGNMRLSEAIAQVKMTEM